MRGGRAERGREAVVNELMACRRSVENEGDRAVGARVVMVEASRRSYYYS